MCSPPKSFSLIGFRSSEVKLPATRHPASRSRDPSVRARRNRKEPVVISNPATVPPEKQQTPAPTPKHPYRPIGTKATSRNWFPGAPPPPCSRIAERRHKKPSASPPPVGYRPASRRDVFDPAWFEPGS